MNKKCYVTLENLGFNKGRIVFLLAIEPATGNTLIKYYNIFNLEEDSSEKQNTSYLKTLGLTKEKIKKHETPMTSLADEKREVGLFLNKFDEIIVLSDFQKEALIENYDIKTPIKSLLSLFTPVMKLSTYSQYFKYKMPKLTELEKFINLEIPKNSPSAHFRKIRFIIEAYKYYINLDEEKENE